MRKERKPTKVGQVNPCGPLFSLATCKADTTVQQNADADADADASQPMSVHAV